MIDLTGRQIGRLRVVRFLRRECVNGGTRPRSYGIWTCQCLCGRTTEVRGENLRTGHTQSCGCASLEQSGPLSPTYTHGKTDTPEYRIWADMLTRCLNPQAAQSRNYLGRGITVCDRWRDFANFIADMGPRPSPDHSIDRIDNDGNYEPQNCRWATRVEQGRNRRTTLRITYLGVTLPLKEWCERLGLPYKTVHQRHRAGWDVNRTFTTPIGGAR